MAAFEFDSILIRPEGSGTWTFVNVPEEISLALGKKGQVKVKGTINGVSFRSSLRPHGDGTHYLVMDKTMRDEGGVKPGDPVRVVLEPDFEERTVSVPEDLSIALQNDAQAHAAYERLSYSHKKEFVEWIEDARQATTRESRVSKAMEMLKQGTTPKSRTANS